ncbi:hypothetical protein HDE69_002112 [Pedobacter cryoconitis]|uniref:DUF2784 domain-containing protein n=1 Tax=Pedobacter cryoconitis TaxID=188932 RepID=A0A7W8YSN1_9SPHI|nr:DUF2784 domain-containing protein [Pedobacter cryoconitis]MBB5621059.1 hypothetical protein [Pedobacter cryoconitis]
MNYLLLDWFFTLLHLIIIGFNLLGWIWQSTRKLHLMVVALTLGCWLILGIWYGLGYCPITDWQWQIKEKLGEVNLPNSFIKYYADKISGQDISSLFIDIVTGVSFALAVILTIYMNFIKRKHI